MEENISDDPIWDDPRTWKIKFYIRSKEVAEQMLEEKGDSLTKKQKESLQEMIDEGKRAEEELKKLKGIIEEENKNKREWQYFG